MRKMPSVLKYSGLESSFVVTKSSTNGMPFEFSSHCSSGTPSAGTTASC